jgi:hypothetical protein
MKRIFCIISLGMMVAAWGASQDLATYAYLYDGAETISDQLQILQQVEKANLSDSEEFFVNALGRLLLEYPTAQLTQERAAAETTARFLAEILGNKKYTAAGRNLWRTVEVFPNPLVKADALVALGKVGAVTYFPHVLQVLKELNERPVSDREGGERIAYGAILSLENYQDIPDERRKEAAVEVYLAATGWYSDRIQKQAETSLAVIAQDPSEPYRSIIQGSPYSYENKYKALQSIEAGQASTAVKAEVALAALTEGWRLPTNDSRLRAILTNIRKLAIDMINRYHTEDAAVYPLLERSYRQGTDTQEKYDAVATLASLGTDEAVGLLSSFLMVMNAKLQSNSVTTADLQMTRALLAAIGETGNAQGRPAVNVVLSLNWTDTIKRLANETLTRLR